MKHELGSGSFRFRLDRLSLWPCPTGRFPPIWLLHNLIQNQTKKAAFLFPRWIDFSLGLAWLQQCRPTWNNPLYARLARNNYPAAVFRVFTLLEQNQKSQIIRFYLFRYSWVSWWYFRAGNEMKCSWMARKHLWPVWSRCRAWSRCRWVWRGLRCG